MFEKILTTLRWSFSVGNKFFSVVPGTTLLIIASTLVSQLSILFAFLLPLKIIMLLGSPGMPGYFPSFLSFFSRDVLVLLLSLCAVIFYMVHMVSERIILRISRSGAEALLLKSQKMILFENQEEVARRAFQRYSRSVAGGVFLLMVSAVIGLIYSGLLLFLVGYIICVFSLFGFLYGKSSRFRKGLVEDLPKYVNSATGVGFLLSFGYMVGQFLWGAPPGILIAVISLILMRQGFSRINGLVNDLKGLFLQRLKLNALFFHGHVLVSEEKKHEVSFWTLLERSSCERWMPYVISQWCDHEVDKVDIGWIQLGVQDVATFHVKSLNDRDELVDEFLVKVFNVNRVSHAKHEATLLSEQGQLPSLKLLGVEDVEGLHCHIMHGKPAKKVSSDNVAEAKQELALSLLSFEPSKQLVSQFKRSRPPLWRRIDQRMIDRLLTVADMISQRHSDDVNMFKKSMVEIAGRLSDMPLMIVNPDTGSDSIRVDKGGRYILLHWGRWTLEPVGAGWPIMPEELERHIDALSEAKASRPDLRDLHESDVRLSALVYSLEKQYMRQNFVGAINTMPRIIESLEESRCHPVVAG
ncbi:hypothetical protein [Halomonas maura]|uniref:hypothetical protein n=1 Tax=Halomonas maura TaxID=117606 RepID=UPI0025B3C5D9|nr:hypothetical protein [Halomonas maura]MDN3554967.1 hypothetical protein [Halomonas maura]